MICFGDIPAGTVLYVPFNTYNAAGASVTLTGLAVTDIEIYKNGSVTQRASDAGYTLLDTDGIDFDGITGLHGFSIDLADNTDAGFFSAGGQYFVAVSAVTVDSQTVNFIAATFSIEIVGGAIALAKAVKAKTDNLPSDPADASDIATATGLIAGYIDTEVAAILAAVDTEVGAIKAKTDSLTFTVAGKVDANIHRVNNVAVDGTGTDVDPWGPV